MEDINDIKGLIQILPLWQKHPTLLIIFASILILTALLILFLYFKKRKLNKTLNMTKEPNLSPYEKAINNLLQAQELMHPGMDKLLASKISDIIRHYIEQAFKLQVSEKTTEEFLYNIQQEMTFSPKPLQTLALFLEMCDFAKFAKIEFTPYEQNILFEKAKSFLDLAHQEELKPTIEQQPTKTI